MNQYSTFINELKKIIAAEKFDDLPRLLIVQGPSEFLRRRTFHNIQATIKKLGASEPLHTESVSLEPMTFRSLWSQSSLFERELVHIIRRCDKHPKLGSWLKDIDKASSILNVICFEFNDKIPAEVKRQFDRLKAVFLHCVEPENYSEVAQILGQMAKKEGLQLSDSAVKLLIDSNGLDLSRLHNEVQKIALVFVEHNKMLTSEDIAPILGIIREDHVFELFTLLRSKQNSKAQLFLEHLLERGEKSIAVTGILSRYARDLISNNKKHGAQSLSLCATADSILKSRRVHETTLLGSIVDVLTQ